VREFTKPGKEGSAHEKTEGAFVAAMKANKGTAHYIALTSLSGPSRALFLSGYPSLAAVEEERKEGGPTLGMALDKANLADGDLLSEVDESAWSRRDDLSTNVKSGAGMHYMEVSQYVVKPGHEAEFSELAKLYVEGVKAVPEMHWTTYEMMYGGGTGPTFLTLTAYKSMADADAAWGAFGPFAKAVGKDGMKRISELSASCLSTMMTNLFAVSTKMSIPPAEMVAADPAFWTPKPVVKAPAKKP
jgi:quinol monooxygenase YgiN